MLGTHKATLRGDHLEWEGDAPTPLGREEAVLVYVILLDEPAASQAANQGRGIRMAEALEQIASSNPLTGISDPLAWEREMRQERSLPGRNE